MITNLHFVVSVVSFDEDNNARSHFAQLDVNDIHVRPDAQYSFESSIRFHVVRSISPDGKEVFSLEPAPEYDSLTLKSEIVAE